MGYGAILGQAPQIEEALADYDKTIKGTYPIASGQSISAGDVVDVVDGEISRSVTAEPNVKNRIMSNAATYSSICKLSDAHSIVVFGVANSLYVGLVDNSTGKVINYITQTSQYSLPCVVRISDTEAIVTTRSSQNSLTAFLLTVSSDNKIQFNPVYGNTHACSIQFSVALDENRVFCARGANGALSSTIIYRQQGISFYYGVGQGYPSLSFGPNNISCALLPDDVSDNKRVCVCFSDKNDSYKGKAVIATIDSSNNVTWGAVTTFTNSRIATDKGAISTACIGNTVYIAYSISTGHVYATAFSVSNTGLSNQSNELQITSSTSQDPSLCTVSGSVVLSCSAPPPGSPACILSLTGNVLSAGTPFYFNNTISHYCAAAAISPSQFIVAFSDNGNGNYGTSTILTVSGNQIAGSFEVQSKDAIALQSGEAGDSIEVIFSGTTAADWATAGQEITSPGVGGYAPLDDMLWVYPWWASKFGTKIATGSYKGTGTYGENNPTILDLPIDAKILFVECDYKVRDANMSQYPENEMLIIVSGASTAFVCKAINNNSTYSTLNGFAVRVNETGRRYSWDVASFNASAEVQMNQSGKTYRYVAIG